MEILTELDTMVIAVVIGIITSFLVQVIKGLELPSVEKIQGLNILIGLLLGLLSMFLTDYTFTASVIIGLAGGVYSPGIYDMVTTAFSLGDDIDGSA